MVNRRDGVVQRQLRTLFNLGTIGELTDGQLLERFTTRGGEASELAFAALVERHGPMVSRVCRNTLNNPHDVQDAFQATFLVLVKKARSLWVRDSLGPWLHRVAYRVATRARASTARRREHERRVAEMRPIVESCRCDWDDLAAVVHEEIDRLPERYRVPLVLCDLEGRTHEQAARHLGWPVGTIKSRLGRARELLEGRLSRRGQGLPAALLITGVESKSAEAILHGALVESTTRAAVVAAAGKSSAVGVISVRVAMLTAEVLKSMFLTKLKATSMVLLMAGALVTVAAGVVAQQEAGSRPAATADQPKQPLPARTRSASGVEGAAAPAYIRRSRTMMIMRLEEEREAAKQRLDRTVRMAGGVDDAAVAQARKTLQDLDHLLTRVDEVLVDAAKSYPTIFDFSGATAVSVSSAKAQDEWEKAVAEWDDYPPAPSQWTEAMSKAKADWAEGMFKKGYITQAEANLARARYEAAKRARLGDLPRAKSILDEAAIARAREQAAWSEGMFKKGYLAKSQLDKARNEYEDLRARQSLERSASPTPKR
jgi:RNA polymerase sigma factor (sigma-70 family)